MSGLGQQVVKWGPVLIQFLPLIISVGQDIYALWCEIRDNKQQNDAVLKSMKLLNKHQDDVDQLLQDPAQRKALLEGLTILMNRISEHNQGQSGWQKDVPPHSSPSDDNACCSKSGSDSGLCEEMSLTFEQRIEYAILLSQQEAQSHGSSYVEARWREVLEAEDETLARALQESEIYEASRVCAQQYSNAASGGRGSPDKMKEWEEDECAKQKCDKEDCRKGEKEGDEKCSALLKEEEDLLIQMAIRASLEPQQ